MTNTTAADLTALAATLIATDPHATSWVWNAADDADNAGAYVDCSQVRSEPGTWRLEAGDGDDAVQIDMSADDLRALHRQLTIQLMVIRSQQEA